MKKAGNGYKRQTEKLCKVPKSLQDTVPIYRIAKDGIFELEKKKGPHLFDRLYRFEDINFSTQDEEEKEQTVDKFRKLLNAMNVSYKILISNHYQDSRHLRESVLQKAVSKDGEALAEKYHTLIEHRIQEGRKGLEQSRYFVLTCRKPDYESARNYFHTVEFTIRQFFKKMGSELEPLSAGERLRLLHGFYRLGKEDSFSFDWDEYLSLRRDWRNDIVNTSLFERKEHLELEGDTVACTLFIRTYASGLSDLFLQELTNVDFPITFALDCEPVDNQFSYQMILKKYNGNEQSMTKQQQNKNQIGDYTSDVSYEKSCQKKEIKDILDGLRSYDERLFYVGITILLVAESEKELARRKEQIMMIGNTYTMEIVPHSWNQLDAFLTTLPTGCRFVDTMRSLTTESLSVFTPFNVQEVSEAGGHYYGINQVSKNLILGNRKNLKNGNGFVFGVPGSGKSFDEKMEMGQVLCFSKDMLMIVDPMGEYREIADAWNGQYINLSQSAENAYYVNPFHVPESIPDEERFIAEKAEFAYAICEQAVKPAALTNRHISIIDHAVRGMYQEFFYRKERAKKKEIIESPTLKNLQQRICEQLGEDEEKNRAVHDLSAQLEVFVDGTLDIFARQQSGTTDNRCTVYGFADLGKRLRPMAMLVMIESITSQIKYNQEDGIASWVYVDEIHELWNDEYSLLAVERLWREVRKRGGICTGMTQNMIDALQSRATKTMISNSEFTVFLNQGVMDLDMVSELFGFSQTQVSYINGASPGCGLIRFGNKIVPFDNTVSSESDLYQLFNTNFHELHREG